MYVQKRLHIPDLLHLQRIDISEFIHYVPSFIINVLSIFLNIEKNKKIYIWEGKELSNLPAQSAQPTLL